MLTCYKLGNWLWASNDSEIRKDLMFEGKWFGLEISKIS